MANTKLKLEPSEGVCVTAAGKRLKKWGQTHLTIKIQGFPWKFPILVVHDLVCPVISGCYSS